MLIIMAKCVLIAKTLLLIMISEIVIEDLNAINKGILMENSNRCCIDIVKWTNNLRHQNLGKMTCVSSRME